GTDPVGRDDARSHGTGRRGAAARGRRGPRLSRPQDADARSGRPREHAGDGAGRAGGVSQHVMPVTFDDVARAYDTFIGRWTRAFLPALLRAARIERGQRVLDLPTGTGEPALMALDAVGAGSRVARVDGPLPILRAAPAHFSRR